MNGSHDGVRRVRTRVAPSPTGDPHVGTAYVALINYCFAKKYGGDFILRIEDTDRARSSAASETAILEALRWLGLSWSEGPDVGGPHAPYRQSERSAIYAGYAAQLLADGNAFRCFCTSERLDAMREAQRAAKEPSHYDGNCLSISPEASAGRAAAGEPFVVRMKIPASGVCVVNDLRRGPVEYEWGTVDMQVLLKSDGMPTYHLANVVDDHLMEITHVIRGEEWLNSAPKHLLLYEYFGWEAPALLHLPLLRNPDKTKLSKRKNPTSILFYERMGYLAEALLNFLGLFFTSSPEGEEMFSLPDLVERFDFEHISLGGPVFDVPKLDWLNGRYLRTKSTPELLREIRTWAFDELRLERIVSLAGARIERLSDLGSLVAFFFSGNLHIERDALLGTKIDPEIARKALALASWRLDAAQTFDVATIDRVLKEIASDLGQKFKDIVRVYYVAITGSPTSVPLYDSMEILGRDVCRQRLRHALELLGGVSGKEERAWRNEAVRPPAEVFS